MCTNALRGGGVKTTGKTIPPVVVSFNWVGRVVVLSQVVGIIVVSAASASTIVTSIASTAKICIVLLLLRGCVV